MRDDIPFEGSADELVLQAMLYASGELEEDQAAEFERRLGLDQSVRDALCRAVELVQTLSGEALPGPDPSYRAAVTRRLRQRRRHRQALNDQSGPATNPALWSVLGAVAAVLVMVAMGHIAVTHSNTQPPPPTQNSDNPAVPPSGRAGTDEQSKTAEMANVWAELHSSDRLEKVHDEEMKRKLRLWTPPSTTKN